MKLIYLHHSGFAILADQCTIVIDFYEDSLSEKEGILHSEILNRKGKMYVLASHFHADHFNKQIFEWRNQKEDITYILSNDIRKRRKISFSSVNWLKKGETYDDETIKIKAFGSTDVGISFMIEIEGKKIFHAGDLNNWHWMDESSEEEWKSDEKRFLKEIEQISKEYNYTDLTMFPIDPRLGKEYMRGGIQFTQTIKTSIFIPMHFGDDFGLAHIFQEYAKEKGIQSPLITHRGQVFNNLL